MKIALVQLSDIHIADSKNEVLGRARQIRAAVRSCVEFPNIVALLYTGDIAFSGKEDQYHIADKFCSSLRSLFEEDGIDTCEAFIPGNHDLDIGSPGDELRNLANAKVKEDANSIAVGGTLAKRLLEQQDAFFTFAERRTHIHLSDEHRLFHLERFEHQGVTIDFHLFNTAFTSTLSEQPGSLVFPDQVIPAETPTDADLAISLLHHPLHWLEPANARRLKKFVESGCDLIFTGHEHLPDAFVKIRTKENQSCYVEGSSLYDPPAKSAFNVVEVDFDSKVFRTRICTWHGQLYSPGSPRELPLVRNISTSGAKYRNTHEFSRWLEDPGTLFTHNQKRDLRLSDFFVYPTMRKDSEEHEKRAFVDSAECPKYLAESKRVLILGEEGSGKTSLAKSLYRQYLSDTTDVPLLLNGDEFGSVSEKESRALIRKAFQRQYGEGRLEQYVQAPPSSKALIIDDWHKMKFNARGQVRIMKNLERTFGKIICLSSDLLTVEQITVAEEANQLFAGFDKCSLPEFGVRLRGRLIERWHSIGQEYTITDDNLAFVIKQSENRINLLLEKNFLPSFPFVVLTLLQADDSPTGNANLGSYGHLYELLITRRLGESSDKLTDLGTKYTYISRLAYYVLLTDRPKVSMGEMKELHERYCEEYGQILDLRKMLAELEQAQIISRDADSIRFKYKACYCYFAAKYFQENLAHDEQGLRAKLREIADRVFYEDYANIVIFFVFLTKDAAVIQQIVQNANKIYSELPPCNFDSDVALINALLKQTPKKLMLSSDVKENREEARRKEDESSEEHAPAPERAVERIEYSPELDDLPKITIALRNLRILGHVLRNFTGVLRKDLKNELAKASYGLALRVLKRVFVLLSENLESFRAQFAELLRVRRAAEAKDDYDLATEDELKRAVDEALITVTRGAGFGMIKRLSLSLGSEDLALTYQGIRSDSGEGDLAVRLIDLAIKLDHFRQAPKSDIEDLAKRLSKNFYSFTLLQDLVAEYLYLNVSDQRELQTIGSLVEINAAGKAGFLLHKRKALQAKNP